MGSLDPDARGEAARGAQSKFAALQCDTTRSARPRFHLNRPTELPLLLEMQGHRTSS